MRHVHMSNSHMQHLLQEAGNNSDPELLHEHLIRSTCRASNYRYNDINEARPHEQRQDLNQTCQIHESLINSKEAVSGCNCYNNRL